MKKNNRGFTMIEIIGVVVIMGVLLLLIIPSVSKLMAQFRKDYYEKIELTVTESGKDFFADNKIYLPDGILESTYVNVKNLIDNKYTESLLDYRGDSCSLEDKKSYTIAVYKGNGKYEYKTCIDCSNDGYITKKEGTYCDPSWLSNDNIGYDYGGTKDIYFYYGTSRDKIRERLTKSLNIVKYKTEDKKEEDEIDRVAIGEEGILPTNIDIINNKPVLDSDNKKEYLMVYGSELDDDKVMDDNTLKAVIYKHQKPNVIMETIDDKNKKEDYDGKIASWTNKNIIITLEKNEKEKFLNDNKIDGLPKHTISKYQMSKNGGQWEDVTCYVTITDPKTNLKSCQILVDVEKGNYLVETYKFRYINDSGNISDETDDYKIRIDKIDPTLDVSILRDTVKVTKTIDEKTSALLETVITQHASISYTTYDEHSKIDRTDVERGLCTGDLSSLYCDSTQTIVISTFDKAGNRTDKLITVNYDITTNYVDSDSSGGNSGENDDSGDGGGSTPVIPSHRCNSDARSANSEPFTRNEILDWGPNYVNEYEHWCNHSAETQSCISGNSMQLYYVTCSICGKKQDGYWCPVHAYPSDTAKPICDAESGDYSGCKKISN